MEDSTSLYNLTWKYNLHCSSQLLISSFGMLFFTGFAVGSFFIPANSDKYGRKLVLIGCLTLQLFTIASMLMVPVGPQEFESMYINYFVFLFFLFGVCTSGRVAIGFVYFCEFAPAKYHNIMGTIMNISEGMIYIYLTLYFYYGGKNWEVPVKFSLFLTTLGLAMVSRMPESPKWLFNQKRYKECHSVLIEMLYLNKNTK